jgi:hypothetical protein
MRRFIMSLLGSLTAATLGCAEPDRPISEDIDPKLQEISKLPIGLKVKHSPNPVKAQRGGRSGRQYTWLYETSVESAGEPVTISEFGSFAWLDGRWGFSNFTGRPFSAEEFVEWYSCPDAKVMPGKNYTDPANWSGNESLRSGKHLWYFVGVTAAGKKVKGEAVVEELGEVEP